MSTRCVVNFTYGDKIDAKVYRLSDGYPRTSGSGRQYGVLPDLYRFFHAVKTQTHDTRFDDPCYLAAKFVVWEASELIRTPGAPLSFLGVGVTQEDPGDIEFRYFVDCTKTDSQGYPVVRWEEA